MDIDEKLVRHVAQIARLSLSDEEIAKFTPEMQDIIGLFEELSDMKLDDDPSFQPLEIKDVMREDTPGECLTQEQALSLTEHKKDGYFKGPKAI